MNPIWILPCVFILALRVWRVCILQTRIESASIQSHGMSLTFHGNAQKSLLKYSGAFS